MWPRATQYYLAARGLEIHALEAGWVPEPVRVPIPRSRSPQSDHCANPTLKKHKCSFITQVLTVAEWDYMNVYVRIGKERSKPTVTSFCTGDTNENTTTSGKSTKIRTRLHLNESPKHYRCTKLANWYLQQRSLYTEQATGMGNQGIVVRFLVRSSTLCPDRLWGPPSPQFNGCWGRSFAGGKAARAWSWPIYPVPRLKNEWSHTSTSPCIHGVHRDKLTSLTLTPRN